MNNSNVDFKHNSKAITLAFLFAMKARVGVRVSGRCWFELGCNTYENVSSFRVERRNEGERSRGKRVRSWINIFNYRAWFRVEVSKKHKESRSPARCSPAEARMAIDFPRHFLKIASSSFPYLLLAFPRGRGGEFSRSNFVILSFYPPSISPMFIGFLRKLARGHARGRESCGCTNRRTRSDFVSVTFLRLHSVSRILFWY